MSGWGEGGEWFKPELLPQEKLYALKSGVANITKILLTALLVQFLISCKTVSLLDYLLP